MSTETVLIRVTARWVRWLPWPTRTFYMQKETSRAEAESIADVIRARGGQVEFVTASQSGSNDE